MDRAADSGPYDPILIPLGEKKENKRKRGRGWTTFKKNSNQNFLNEIDPNISRNVRLLLLTASSAANNQLIAHLRLRSKYFAFLLLGCEKKFVLPNLETFVLPRNENNVFLFA